MALRLITIVVLCLVSPPDARSEEPEPKLRSALTLLGQTKSGREGIALAHQLKIPIHLGAVSRTDITATRMVEGRKEALNFHTQVLVSTGKTPVFQALDLAHELIHATHPKSNPFDPDLDLATYVEKGIEGEGGEAQAIAQECRVGHELIELSPSPLTEAEATQISSRCEFVWRTVPEPSKWKRSFYFLGKHYRDFMKNLAQIEMSEARRTAWEEKVDSKSPIFFSAVAHKPYPLALLEEYVDITKKICEKSKEYNQGRSIASLPSLAGRCNSVGVSLKP